MKRIYFTCILICQLNILPEQSYAQGKCGTMPYLAESIARNPNLLSILNEYEKVILNSHKNKTVLSQNLIVIPVVVHVVWNTPDQNISDAQILSQINVLNEDYRKMAGTNGWNTNSIGADTKIEFRLAEKDMNGLATNGIERVKTAVASFTNTGPQRDFVKSKSNGGADAWNAKNYLNIWICNLVGSGPGQLLGYATFPGEPLKVDGVVIFYKAFGDNVGTAVTPPFDLGRTTTHEVGHWLNLFHTFQGGCLNTNCLEEGDKVCDTPPVETATSKCPIGRISCGEQTLINDYMDYSSDNCMNLYTDEQNYRMRITLDAIRTSLKTSPALSDHNFFVFGTHTGNYMYVLDGNFYVEGTGVYSGFAVQPVSSVQINSRGNHPVILGNNTKIINGGTFSVVLQ